MGQNEKPLAIGIPVKQVPTIGTSSTQNENKIEKNWVSLGENSWV